MSKNPPQGKLASMLALKCPRCREGDLFYTGSFSMSRPTDMRDRCEVCDQDFQIEPGFYFGAMFISYIFMGWFCIAFAGVLHWVIGWSITASFALLIGVIAIFFIYIFRAARSIWIGFNVKYQGRGVRSEE